jgi:Tol biopolymer transport system component
VVSSNNGSFTPNSQWISFLADRGNKTQIYLISINGGEAFPITKDEDGIGNYRWSPDGSKIAYTKQDSESKKEKSKKDRYGGFGVEGQEFKLNHLWIVPFNLDSIFNAGWLPCYTSKQDSAKKGDPCYSLPKATRLTEGEFTVSGFEWKPDGKQIAFTRQPDPQINSGIHSDIAIVNIADKKITIVISNPSSDYFTEWSPRWKFHIIQ